MSDFAVEVSQRGQWTIIAVSGEIYASSTNDQGTCSELRNSYLKVMEETQVADRPPFLIFDLSQTEFVDSTGLSVFVGALRRAKNRHGEVLLVVPEPRILKIFQVTSLTKTFIIRPTVEEAIAEFEAGQA